VAPTTHAVGVGLTLVSSVHGVEVAAVAEGFFGCPNPCVGLAAPRLGNAPVGRGRPHPNAGRSLGRAMPEKTGAPSGNVGWLPTGMGGRGVCETIGAGAEDSSSSSHGSSSSLLSGAVVWIGRAADEGRIGVTWPFEGALEEGVAIGRAMLGMLGMGVAVASDEHGVLGYTDGFGTPGSSVNAGALLGLNDREAGTLIMELYGSGWSSSTGADVEVGLGTEAGVLIGSMVAPGMTIAKLGRSKSTGKTAESPVRSERIKVDCNIVKSGLIYREIIETNDQRTEGVWGNEKQRTEFAKTVKR
jgi:hypothetical protein